MTSVGGDLPDGPPFSEFDREAGFGIYGTVKAALNRLTKSLAAELYDDGIAVNAAAPSNPVATEGAGALDLAKTDTEDIALITQTAFELCTGDPKTLTGRIAHTQPFLREIGWLREGSARRVPADHAAARMSQLEQLDSGRYHSIWLPDHMVSFWPDSIWTPEFTDLATASPSPAPPSRRHGGRRCGGGADRRTCRWPPAWSIPCAGIRRCWRRAR